MDRHIKYVSLYELWQDIVQCQFRCVCVCVCVMDQNV